MLSLVPPPVVPADMASVTVPAEAGVAEVVTLGRQRPERGLGDDEERFFTDTLAEYQWARDCPVSLKMRHERGADLRCLKYVRQPGASIVSLIMRQGSEALPESLQVSGTSVSSI